MSDELRMDAYYYGFVFTSAKEIDLILSAIACAGKAFHHTEDWNDEALPYAGHEGQTPIDWIQNAAIKAATELTRLRERNAELETALKLAKNSAEDYDKDCIDMRYQRDAVTARNAELEKARDWLKGLVNSHDLLKDNANLRAKLERAKEALAAIAASVTPDIPDADFQRRARYDLEEVARAVLAELSADAPAMQTQNSDAVREAMAEAKDALASLLDCPEISDADPRDKDHETHAAERKARAAIAKLRSVMK